MSVQISGAEAAVRALVGDHPDGREAGIAIVDRSPLGPYAVRIRPRDGAQPDAGLARWLADRSWVDGVCTCPPHLYCRITTDALASWVTSSNAQCTAQLSAVHVHVHPTATSDAATSLEDARAACTAAALAALLHHAGVSGRDRAHDVEVGAVDVPHGPLRSRHGGTLSAGDLMSELERLTARSTAPAAASVAYALTLLGAERHRRLVIDDAQLRSASGVALTLAELCDAQADHATPASSHRGSARVDRAVRDLAIQVDRLAPMACRAARELEPVLLVRSLRALADCIRTATLHLPGSHPLWAAAVSASRRALALTTGGTSP